MNKPYKLSKDYRLLRKLLDNGNEIVCFFDGEVCRGRVLEDKRYCRYVIRWAFKQANRHHSCFIYVGVIGCQMIVSNNKRKLRRNRLKYVEKKRMFYNLLSRYSNE